MNDKTQLDALKKLTATVYMCQIFAFALAGLPLLVGVAINFWRRDEVKGTWLESHFNWQIKTVWMALAGFALAGLLFDFGIGMYLILPTILLLIYRIVIGWTALNADKAVRDPGN